METLGLTGYAFMKKRQNPKDIKALEVEYNFELPFLYKEFARNFELESIRAFEKLIQNGTEIYFAHLYCNLESIHESDFSEFMAIEDTYRFKDNDYDWTISGHLPIGGGRHGSVLLLGTKDEEYDKILLQDIANDITIISNNIFEFVSCLDMKILQENIAGIELSSIYKKLRLTSPPELRRYPDENKVVEWMENSFFLPDEVDANGNPMLINPNYGTPDADKILTVDVEIIN
jgi:hypothetical protein